MTGVTASTPCAQGLRSNGPVYKARHVKTTKIPIEKKVPRFPFRCKKRPWTGKRDLEPGMEEAGHPERKNKPGKNLQQGTALLKNAKQIPLEVCIENLKWIPGDGVQGGAILVKAGAVDLTFKNTALSLYEGDPCVLLVAANSAGRDKCALQVPGHNHIIANDKITVIL
jgi:hypothetical protein